MQISKRVIHLAKERALFGFSMLSQRMVSDTDSSLSKAISLARSGFDQKNLSAARQFLQQDGKLFQKRLDAFFSDYLERAMQTMYTDLRTGLHNMSADRLSLIDDETVNRQIEVDRLVQRMRDMDHENLGRLNLIIAQLHGDHNVRERENPFRPYLLARSLHEVLGSMVKEEALAKLLFDYLSNAMINQLPGYYASVREVFESNGVRTRLLAQPSMMSPAQRELMAQRAIQHSSGITQLPASLAIEPQALTKNFDSRILPGLQRMQASQQKSWPNEYTIGDVASTATDATQAIAFQDFVWQIFNKSKLTPMPRSQGNAGQQANSTRAEVDANNDVISSASSLISELHQYQRLVAKRQSLGEASSPDQNQLFALKDKLNVAKTNEMERVTIDVVTLLFEFILQDTQIPADLRNEIGRLQIPFLKAAMLAPEMLQQPDHPARQLLNRIGAVAVTLDQANPLDKKIATEIVRGISCVLEQFDEDIQVFSNCLEEFEISLAELLRNVDQATARRIAAIEEAERASVVLFNTANTLHDLLPPLNIDTRITDFIMQAWVRVLAYVQSREVTESASTAHAAVQINEYRGVLPELVWSAQFKHTSQERNSLVRLLPDLVKRLKKGLELIRLPEAQVKQALDRLVEVHTQVLRGAQPKTAQHALSLEDLYQHFSMLLVCEGSYLWTEDELLGISPEVIQVALADRGVTATLVFDADAIPGLAPDNEWLAQMRLGIGIVMDSDKGCEPARLSWISSQRSLFMFTSAQGGEPFIYSATTVLKSLRDGTLRMIEYAPLFERAVESLMVGAETMQSSEA